MQSTNFFEEVVQSYRIPILTSLSNVHNHSQESLDTLQEMVVKMFSDVENKNVEIKEWKEHPYGEEQVGVRGHIVPVKVGIKTFAFYPSFCS